jgi:hypothetical protein
MRVNTRVGVIALFLVVSAAAIAVLSPGRSIQSSTTAAVQSNSFDAGMKVYLDPETGDVTSAPQADPNAVFELDAAEEAALSQDSEGLAVEKHADGTVSMNLQGRFQSASFVRLDKNGKAIVCTDNVTDAEQSLNATSSNLPEVK